MIISLRGTSGSGKTHVVREVLRAYGITWSKEDGWAGPIWHEGTPPGGMCALKAHYREGRRNPLWYELIRPGKKNIALLGSYENVCGGCDTIKGYEEVFDLVKECHALGHHVLFEGVMLYAEVKRTVRLCRDVGPDHFLVISMNVPIEKCLEGIRARREGRGDARPLNPQNTINKHKQTIRTMHRLKDHKVPAEWQDREGTLKRVREVLDVPSAG